MTVRQMEFNTGEETATIPTVSDPSADTDFVTKGYGDVNYMQGGRAVADVAALKAVAAADRHDNDIRLVDSLNALFKFDASSSDTGDDSTVITPDAGTGRWLITTSSGSGSGSGSRNYLQDSGSDTAESNIGDWVTYADAAGTTPVDGTGGSASITFTRNTTTPLRQTADFKLTVDAANRQGNGSSVDFAVDRADRNKVIGIWCDIDATDSNYADDDLQVFIYDVDTSTLITPYTPSGAYKIKAQKYRFRVAFSPANTSSVNYRLIVHVASTNATGYSVYFDNFEVGPGNQLQYGFDGIWKPYSDAEVATTSAQGGFSVVSANFVPKKLTNGSWTLSGSGQANYTAATISSLTIAFAGVTFKTGITQQAGMSLGGSASNQTLRGGYAIGATGNIQIQVVSTGNTSQVYWSFSDLLLDSKPTWADFDPIATIYPTTDDLAFTPTESFTPTGSWTTNTTYSGIKSRSFDKLIMSVRASLSGAPNAVTMEIDLPPGLTVYNPTGGNKRVGSAFIYDSNSPANRQDASVTAANGADYLSLTVSEGGVINATNPFTWASGDLIDLFVVVPITEWQNNGQIPPIGLEIAQNGAPGLIKSYTESTETINMAFNGTGGVSSVDVDVVFTKIGRQVTMTIPAFSGTSRTGSTFLSGTMPSEYLPKSTSTQIKKGFVMRNNGATDNTSAGAIEMTSGLIYLYRDFPVASNPFTNGTNCGLQYAASITYTAAE